MVLSSKPKRKLDNKLFGVLLASGAFHVLLLLLLGGLTIYEYIIPDEAEFDEPPEIEETEPPPEREVEIEPQTASQDQPLQQLQMQDIGNIAISDVNLDLPEMQDSFTVSTGLEGGLQGSSLLGGSDARGVDLGMSDVNVFGLKTQAERILFLINAGPEMVVDEKGGLFSYDAIKKEITDMVGKLSTGTLFNVILFNDKNVKMFKPKLVSAGQKVTGELENWIQPINSDADEIGLQGDASKAELNILEDENITETIRDVGKGIQHENWNQDRHIAHYALQQNADAIFMLTHDFNSFERVRAPLSEQQRKAWEREKNSSGYQKQLEAYKKEREEKGQKYRKRVEKELEKLNKKRKAQGLPPKVFRHGGLEHKARELGIDLEWEEKHPGHEPLRRIESRYVRSYFRRLTDKLYRDKGDDKPSFNIIFLMAEDHEVSSDKKEQLDRFTRFFDGDFRFIYGREQITDYSTVEGLE
ncbi:MAG: hypothetical protein ACLFUF_03035, partial [Opitutales bacterium]